MTSNTKQDLDVFMETLSPDEKKVLERIIEAKGEDYAISVLGHLKIQVEQMRSL